MATMNFSSPGNRLTGERVGVPSLRTSGVRVGGDVLPYRYSYALPFDAIVTRGISVVCQDDLRKMRKWGKLGK
jgi:hypothetical protein